MGKQTFKPKDLSAFPAWLPLVIEALKEAGVLVEKVTFASFLWRGCIFTVEEEDDSERRVLAPAPSVDSCPEIALWGDL